MLTLPRRGYYGPIPHWGDARVTRSTRGTGRPGHEPDGSRKTGRSSPLVRDESTSGAVARRVVRTAKEAYRWIAGASRSRRVSRTPLRLPATYDDALRRGLDALGIDLAPEVAQAIEGHVRLLLAWTPSINLTAIRDADAVATGHVVDSLTALPWIAAHRPQRLLDLGSGGGFPGLPLAAALRPTLPSIEVTLLEPTAKKARFLSTAIEATGLGDRVSVDARRAEDLARDPAARGRRRCRHRTGRRVSRRPRRTRVPAARARWVPRGVEAG